MNQKQYDLFVSYASRDRAVVHGLAAALRSRGIRVWIDAWEMQPGDSLRHRIADGIERASYFLIIVSQASLASNWVKYELSSGLLLEVEAGNVRVLPALGPGADFSDLPTDLRAKYCLDIRSRAARLDAVDRIVSLIKPERRERAELLDALRNPSDASYLAVARLREYANRYGDQAIQVAALRGLSKIPGPSALVAVAEAVS